MRIAFLLTLLLLSVAASAQVDTTKNSDISEDSLWQVIGRNPVPRQAGDTTGMAQYGMRLYDARMGRYIPADPYYTSAPNPYGYAKKPAVKKKPVKNSKGR